MGLPAIVNSHFVNIDQMEIDKVEIDEVGRYQWEDSRDFQNSPLFHGCDCPLLRARCLLSEVPCISKHGAVASSSSSALLLQF